MVHLEIASSISLQRRASCVDGQSQPRRDPTGGDLFWAVFSAIVRPRAPAALSHRPREDGEVCSGYGRLSVRLISLQLLARGTCCIAAAAHWPKVQYRSFTLFCYQTGASGSIQCRAELDQCYREREDKLCKCATDAKLLRSDACFFRSGSCNPVRRRRNQTLATSRQATWKSSTTSSRPIKN